MGFELEIFKRAGEDGLEVDYMEWLVDEQSVNIQRHFGRLWEYYANPTIEASGPGACERKVNESGQCYVQAQEYGLPARITDCRAGHNVVVPCEAGGVKKTIEAHTSNDTLTAAESGSVHSNLGATGTVTLTLPGSAPAGTVFTFAVQAAQELRVDPGAAAMRDDSGQTADKYKSADAVGECVTLVADANGDWVTIAKNGTWTEEA